MGFCVQPPGASGLTTTGFAEVQLRIHAPLNCKNNNNDLGEFLDAACSLVNI